MPATLTRHPANPIVRPGGPKWRRATTYNPGVLYEDGVFWMLERASPGLHPHITWFGLLRSEDGVHFEHVVDRPVLKAADFGFPLGSIEDPRLVKLDGRYVITFALQEHGWMTYPTGWGLPRGVKHDIDHYLDVPPARPALTRSGIAVSDDLEKWEFLSWATDEGVDDRDVILFPEKVNGRYLLFRRPREWVGAEYGCDQPSIWITASDDLKEWDTPRLLISPREDWEFAKIGADAPPVRTSHGWLVLYHGVP